MPFDSKKKYGIEDIDPELEAEKEFESHSSDSKKYTVSNKAEKTDMVKYEIGNEEASFPDSQNKCAVNYKEAKATRKKRCRGVSGSSIKKDGGRFEYGLDFSDDFDLTDMSEDEIDSSRYDNHASLHLNDDENDDDFSIKEENVIRFQKCLIETINDLNARQSLHSITEVLTEFFDEQARIEIISMALGNMISSDEWTTSGAIDRMAEYNLVSLLAKIIDQGLISVEAFHTYIASNLNDSQSLRLMRSAVAFFQSRAIELAGDHLSAPPKEFSEIAEDLCRSGEVDCVREALEGCPFFHTDIIFQVCTISVNSMNMDMIFNASKTFKDLLSEKIMTSAAINSGVARFLKELRDIEVDLPAASSLAFLLVSYCIESPACIDVNVYKRCPRPKKFLRKRTTSSGRLSIRDDSEEKCTETNYLECS